MRFLPRTRRLVLYPALYLVLCGVAGVIVADGALHPARRAVTPDDETAVYSMVRRQHATLADVSITTPDRITLRGWLIHPAEPNRDAVMVFHGLADNRLGMAGYAELLLAHGYTVLMPNARAHGLSGGEFATYGLLERHDIGEWFDWLEARDHPHCIYGFGESMGAAQLLQSLALGKHFCAVIAESSFSSFREIAYDRMGQPFHAGSWLGRFFLRPLVEAAFLRARWTYHFDFGKVSPEDAVTTSEVSVLLIHGEVDSNIPVRHSRRIHVHDPRTMLWEVAGADHCGAISIAPREFEQRLLSWFSTHSN